ncbi:MAG: DUF1801 domain-containing protein [Cyclobacteriaceae bacterium]
MATLKTQPYNRNISEFLSKVENPQKREDCFTLLDLMKEETGEEPQYWHSNMVGFGQYHYKYASGLEGDWFLTGFSPRKQNLTIYIMSGFERYEELMEQLGRYKTGKSCLYVKRLSDIDLDILKELVRESVSYMREEYK